ncbi:hypothetical protein JVU11DRAFT_8860 [Chiua virens]|nr:hypothetical protein JVU11DRAFT_8860 [Chiua virens]
MAYFARPQSSNAAVRIVNPAEQSDDSKPLPKRESPQRQCRNILIYGSCRFQDKGCIYYHPPSGDTANTANSESPAATPLTPQAVNAPVFVPKVIFNPTVSPTNTQSFVPSPPPAPYYSSHDEYDPFTQQYDDFTQPPDEQDIANEYEQGEDPLTYLPDHINQADYDDSITSMGTYYQPAQPPYIQQPLDYHLYTQPIPDSFAPSHFMSDNVREELQKRAEATHAVPFPPYNLPDELQGYHSLVPLEPTPSDRRKFFSWFSTVYRATSAKNGLPYALRRVESTLFSCRGIRDQLTRVDFRLMHQVAFGAIESWSRIQHPNIVRVREAFTTRAFNDNSLVVSYDYHPNAQTLFDMHLRPKQSAFPPSRFGGSTNLVIPEATLWSYIIQIASAIRATHEAGLAVRMLDPTKILVTGKNRYFFSRFTLRLLLLTRHVRLRISSCGIVDVLMYDTRQDIALVQQEDLVMFGRLLFTLCCGNLGAVNVLPKALDTMGMMYSTEVKTLALYLISKPSPHKASGIAEVIKMIDKNQLLREMDEAQIGTDRLESELASELENGRLVRLLCKFGFINERPEFAREPRWSETEDRYIIKLFRDYVFHQVDENGNAVVNLSHVLACLNKLDSGTDERIMLVSRDEQSCLVVSYKEVKSCIDAAFSDLSRALR